MTNLNRTPTHMIIDKSGKRLDQVIDDTNAQLAQTSSYNEQAYKNLNFLKDNGVFAVIGDSISAGYGISNYNDQYVKKLQDFFNGMTGYTDYETITNFNECSLYGITLSGTTSIGSLGPCKRSLIIQPGAVLTFTGLTNYIDFIYHQTPTSGSLEVRCNGNLYKTINCSGVDTLDRTSFPTASSNTNTSATYTVTCINASVEITGLIRLIGKGRYSNANIMRFAVSGQDTAWFSDTSTLTSIKKVMSFANSSLKDKTYLIALGTNDIYNPTIAKSAAAYSANLETIIQNLLDDNGADQVRVILTVPPIPNEVQWPIKVDPHPSYRNEVYKLAEKYNLSIIDYTNVDFLANNWYQDGIHPNAIGNQQMINYILKTLSIEKPKSKPKVPLATTAASLQSIPNGGFVSVTFSGETEDTDNIYSLATPTKFIINTPGLYLLQANIDFSLNSTGIRGLVFKLNNATYLGNAYINAVNGANSALSTSKVVKLNKGDYIEVQAYQTSGGSLNVGMCEASVVKVG